MKHKRVILVMFVATIAALTLPLLGGCCPFTQSPTPEGPVPKPAPSKIITYLSFSASPAVLDLKYGTVLAFAGQLRGRGETGLSGKTVSIQSKESGEWATIYTLKTDKNGRYFKKHHPSAGLYYFRAKFNGDSRYKPVNGKEQKVTVK